ncbi:MAG: NUDIX hydrolase [candidate division Zixibacteria bacterium]|nr:NUDIX hydrolase [candidate division Zixibacteria bacterium]
MKSPALTVGAVILYPDGDIVLIKRGHAPFAGSWALPGGFVEIGETVEQAIVREAREETGLDIRLERLIGVYSDPARDPRGHTVSVVFLAAPVGGSLRADSDAADTLKTSDWRSLSLAFDHATILTDTFDR